jgi:hypothetical protein
MVISPGFSADLEHVPCSEGSFTLAHGAMLFHGFVKAQRNLAALSFKNDVFEKKIGMIVQFV